MWQVYYYVAVEREHELRRELERRRRLADSVRAPRNRRRFGSIIHRGRELAAWLAESVASVLDRPAVGPHHL